MRPNRAEPARGFSWQTSPQTRKMGRGARFAREPARACRNTSGNRATQASRRAFRDDCDRPAEAPQTGGFAPSTSIGSRRRGALPARHARLSPGQHSSLSADQQAQLSAESGLPRLSICRTTISVIPLDHSRWAGSGRIRTTGHLQVCCHSLGARPTNIIRSTRNSRVPNPSTLPRLSDRPSKSSGRTSCSSHGLRQQRRVATMLFSQ